MGDGKEGDKSGEKMVWEGVWLREENGREKGNKNYTMFFFFWFLSFSSVISLSFFLIFISLFILNNEVSTHIQFFNNNIMCILF